MGGNAIEKNIAVIYLVNICIGIVRNHLLYFARGTCFRTKGTSFRDGLKVMTYNLRYLNTTDSSPHTWAERRPAVKKLIEKERPDIFGTQEAVYQQVKEVDEDLEDYEWIGLGREGGSKGNSWRFTITKIVFHL
jgi:hypothetical protein